MDYDADGRLDLIVGIGWWGDYGWDNAYDSNGKWTNGPLHGYVYLLRNTGSSEKPSYAEPVKLEAGGKIIDGYGMPSPNFADFDGDGDLDLVCGSSGMDSRTMKTPEAASVIAMRRVDASRMVGARLPWTSA